jgi:hypothetical protein
MKAIMSTKIYNGYRLRAASLRSVDRIINRFRARAVPVLREAAVRRIVEVAVRLIDVRALGRQTDAAADEPPILYATTTVGEAYRKIYTTSKRDPYHDFDCHICVVSAKRATLALLYTENHDVTKLWERTRGVEPFPYWNNADQPEDVSPRAWRARGRIWEQAVGHATPATCGYTTELLGIYGLPNPTAEEMLRLAPDVDTRARSFAFDDVVGKRAMDEGKVDFGKVNEAMRWAQSEEGATAVRAATDKIRLQLKVTLTQDDFLGPAVAALTTGAK